MGAGVRIRRPPRSGPAGSPGITKPSVVGEPPKISLIPSVTSATRRGPARPHRCGRSTVGRGLPWFAAGRRSRRYPALLGVDCRGRSPTPPGVPRREFGRGSGQSPASGRGNEKRNGRGPSRRCPDGPRGQSRPSTECGPYSRVIDPSERGPKANRGAPSEACPESPVLRSPFAPVAMFAPLSLFAIKVPLRDDPAPPRPDEIDKRSFRRNG